MNAFSIASIASTAARVASLADKLVVVTWDTGVLTVGPVDGIEGPAEDVVDTEDVLELDVLLSEEKLDVVPPSDELDDVLDWLLWGDCTINLRRRAVVVVVNSELLVEPVDRVETVTGGGLLGGVVAGVVGPPDGVLGP
mmetsp:Transcript_31886/g.72773  ORF Transcript_31886/g.72773 Transcript_31886/m.72773 type:complete len:139 (+) Transcript_31886:1976-2392(+)